jgi:hypothetical protein
VEIVEIFSFFWVAKPDNNTGFESVTSKIFIESAAKKAVCRLVVTKKQQIRRTSFQIGGSKSGSIRLELCCSGNRNGHFWRKRRRRRRKRRRWHLEGGTNKRDCPRHSTTQQKQKPVRHGIGKMEAKVQNKTDDRSPTLGTDDSHDLQFIRRSTNGQTKQQCSVFKNNDNPIVISHYHLRTKIP